MEKKPQTLPGPYALILISLALFVGFAFVTDTPSAILAGLGRIFLSRGVLTTDYIATGGIGAAFVNAAISGACSVLFMQAARIKPNGSTIMAIWMVTGFSFFGKNVLTMFPVVFGVWLYSRFQREPFLNYSLVALLATTLSPLVGELAFGAHFHPFAAFMLGVAMGAAAGFFLPIISAATNRVHGGYDLYNIGFAGGLLVMFLVAFGKSISLQVAPVRQVSQGNNLPIALFLYSLMALWCIAGLIGTGRGGILSAQREIWSHSGRLVTDYYLLFGPATYLNMGVLGMLGTTVTLALGAQLNGVTLAGIFTMMGFGAFGKHLRNCLPVMAGALLMVFINHTPPTDPSNICAILFCTGLAPIAGQYGIVWGVAAGMLHTIIVAHTGQLTAGLNLYSNGFAAGFVALVLVPVILAFRRGKE